MKLPIQCLIYTELLLAKGPVQVPGRSRPVVPGLRCCPGPWAGPAPQGHACPPLQAPALGRLRVPQAPPGGSAQQCAGKTPARSRRRGHLTRCWAAWRRGRPGRGRPGAAPLRSRRGRSGRGRGRGRGRAGWRVGGAS